MSSAVIFGGWGDVVGLLCLLMGEVPIFQSRFTFFSFSFFLGGGGAVGTSILSML